MGATERALALALALGGAGVLIATATFGGRLVFDHAAGIPTEVLTSELRNRSEGHEHAGGEEQDEAWSRHTSRRRLPRAADSWPLGLRRHPRAGDHADPPGTPPHEH